MKHAVTPTPLVLSLFFAFFFAVVLTLAGCSAGTLSGPDLDSGAAPALQEDTRSSGSDADHNRDGADKNGGGSTIGGGAEHNRG